MINTSGSILAAVVFHALTNLSGEIFDPGASGELLALFLWTAAALALVILWRWSGRPNARGNTPGWAGESTS